MKTAKLLFGIITISSALAAQAQAQFDYTTNNGAITLAEYTGVGGALVISNFVTSIGPFAFFDNMSVTSVTIPDSVTSIGEDAFNDCESLTGITIPNSVTNIGHAAFGYCYALTNAIIGNGVTAINDGTFFSCSSLTELTLGSAVASIGTNAFAYCTRLSNVFFEGDCPIADSTAFVGDGDVTTVYYVAGTSGWGATLDGFPTLFWSPPLPFGYTIQNGTISIASYFGSGGAATIPGNIGNLTVTSIGDAAFEGASNLASVTIPDSITSIGQEAFEDCYSLTNVAFGGGVTSIGNAAFYGCSLLANVTIGNSVTSIGDYAFVSCALTNLNLGSAVTSIGAAAFADCTGLTSVTFPRSVTSILDDAFDECTSLLGLYFQGNAPGGSTDIEIDDFSLNSVYYLAGTTGWGTTFDGIPTVRWTSGELQVTIFPPGAVSAGAQWAVDDNPLQVSGTIVSNLALGSHTVRFSTITGWATPPSQTVIVAGNSFAMASGYYAAYSVTVSASPGAGGTAALGGPVALDGTMTVMATANNGYTFSNWTENGTMVSADAIYTFVPSGKINLVANFTAASGAPMQIFYQMLDDPAGAQDTYAFAANGGNVVGYYTDSAGMAHGFLYTNGTYTIFDAPNAGNGRGFGTYAVGISGSNIVGYYTDASENTHGFLCKGGTYVTLDVPNGTFTHATAISGGTILGYFDNEDTAYSFVYTNGAYSTFGDPAANTGDYSGTYAWGISGGQIVGHYVDASGDNRGFLYNGMSWLTLDNPNDDNGSLGTFAQAIGGGYIVGNSGDNGFLYTNGAYIVVDVPTANNAAPNLFTCSQGVSGNTIVGFYADNNNACHAFVATVIGGAAGETPTQISYFVTNASITITCYTGSGAVASIPASINNMPVTVIGSSALFNSAVTNIIIPESVTTIESFAFYQCDAVTNVTIPASVTNIGACPFYGCARLTAINVDPNNPAYSSIAGVLFNKGETSLIEYPLEISGESYSIPDTVTNIGAYAFYLCGNLGSVTIPPGVTSVGQAAFYLCNDLGEVLFHGNAPAGDSTVFGDDRLQYVFYCPGATGWGSTFGGVEARPCSYCCSDQTGSLQVTINPASAISAGAKWQMDGGKMQNSGATVTNLSPGKHTVSFNTISNWVTPAKQTDIVSAYSTTMVSGTYVPQTGSVEVTINPQAAIIAGARWQVGDGTWQNSGATVSNLSVGKHTVSFQGIDYWSAPSNQTVSIKAKAVAKDTGTYTFNAQGIYNGLFAQPDTNVETSGMLSGLTVKASGTYTGKLLIGDSTNAISGSFNASGQATNNIKRTAKQGGPLTLAMWVNWNNSPLTIAGTVSGANGGDWMANLTAELAATGSKSAEYTAQLLPAGTPPGYGYLTITNDKGAVKLIGALADGTSFSQAAPVSGDGDLPVYGNLYSSTGLLLGWIGLESGSPAGYLTWIKEASRSSARYTNGFTNLLLLQGSRWTNPFPHTAAIDLPSGQLGISGGNLLSNLTFNVAVTNNDTLVKLGKTPANSLTGSINAKTGLLTITFGNGAGKATTTGTGAVLQNATNAGGFFLGKTNAGYFLLQP